MKTFINILLMSGIYSFSFLTVSKAQSPPLTMEQLPISWNNFTHKNIRDKHAFDAYTKVDCNASGEYWVDKAAHTVRLKLSFYARMDNKESYVKKSFLKTADSARSRQLLNHEIGHWIISMIYFHQLVHDLETFRYDYRVRYQLDSIRRVYYALARAEQLQYDLETNHSKNARQQQLWEARLLDRLYQAYGTKIDFPASFTKELTITDIH